MKAPVMIAFIAVLSVVGIASHMKGKEPGADIRNPKTLTKIHYDRLPEMSCPPGQHIVWLSAREIGCEA